MRRELVSRIFHYVLNDRPRDNLIIHEHLPLDQPDIFVRGLLEVLRELTIDRWFFQEYGDAFDSDYCTTIENDISFKYLNREN